MAIRRLINFVLAGALVLGSLSTASPAVAEPLDVPLVSGKVTSSWGGAAASYVDVKVEYRQGTGPDDWSWQFVSDCQADQAGNFSVEPPWTGSGTYRVTFERGGYASVAEQFDWDGAATLHRDVVLSPSYRLATGMVRDTSSGLAIAGARVESEFKLVYDDGLFDWVGRGDAITDSQGRFYLPANEGTAGTFHLVVSAPGKQRVITAEFAWDGVTPATVNATMSAAQELAAGRVTDLETGLPISGVQVYVGVDRFWRDGDGGGGPVDITSTDSDGRYTLLDEYGVGTGTVQVRFSAAGYRDRAVDCEWDRAAALNLSTTLEPGRRTLDEDWASNIQVFDTDANRIVYRTDDSSGGWRLRVRDLTTHESWEVAAGDSGTGGGWQASIDGDWVAYLDESYVVQLVNVQSGEQRAVDSYQGSQVLGAGILVFSDPVTHDLMSMNLDSGDVTPFAAGEGWDVWQSASMGGNSGYLAFIREDGGGRRQLVTMDSAGQIAILNSGFSWENSYYSLRILCGAGELLVTDQETGQNQLYNLGEPDSYYTLPHSASNATQIESGLVLSDSQTLFPTTGRTGVQAVEGEQRICAITPDWLVVWDRRSDDDGNGPLIARRRDLWAPTTTARLSATGWTNEPAVKISLSADDATGVREVRYGVGVWANADYTAPFDVSAEGVTTLWFFSVDSWGNAEKQHSVSVRIDRTRPSTEATVSAAGVCTFRAVDALSGVASTHWRIGRAGAWSTGTVPNSSTWSSAVLQYYSTDSAGNSEAVSELELPSEDESLDADVVPPSTVAVGAAEGWRNTTQQVWLLATDAGGVASTSFNINRGSTVPYVGSIEVSAEGVTDIGYWSQDLSGNREATHVVTVRIDRTPPVIVSDAAASYDTSASIAVSATDARSGVAQLLWRLDWGPWSSSPLVSTSEPGLHMLELVATDVAGNRTLPEVRFFTVRGSADVVLASADSTVTVGYGARSTLSGILSSDDKAAVGKLVWLEASEMGGAFVRAGSAVTGFDGAFSFSVAPANSTRYRVAFDGDSYAMPSRSRSAALLPRASVGNPSAPTTMYKGKRKTISGFLNPWHSAGSTPVRICRYRYTSGKWKAYSYVEATLTDYLGASRYAASVSFPSTGRWRVRSYTLADAGHAETWSSGYDYVTVK